MDARTGAPVPSAAVLLAGAGASSSRATDATGAFQLRGLEPGTARITVRALGYLPSTREVDLRNGETLRVVMELEPDPVALEGVLATGAARAMEEGGVRLDRSRLEEGGARTAGEAIRGVPGVVVRGGGPGGAETVSLRGGAPDGVLVLLDGIPLNDPLTGEADLSSVPASALESVTVLPGSRSARYGPRAESGVILLESRAPGAATEVGLAAGSLGERSVTGIAGRRGAVSLAVNGEYRRLHGRFGYDIPSQAGGGSGVRRNGDMEQRRLGFSTGAGVLGGETRARGGWESLLRGMPGRGYAPADSARQRMDRYHLAAEWRRDGEQLSVQAGFHGRRDRLHYRDPEPPFGNPYDDRVHLDAAGGRMEAEVATPLPWIPSAGLTASVEGQRIAADALSADAPGERLDAGVSGRLRLGAPGHRVQGALVLRGDRDHTGGGWVASHELSAGVPLGPLRLRAAHRSGFSPPGLSDQYFREGVGVAPNPDLRPQRVPGEVEVGLSARLRPGPLAVTLDVVAHRGRIDGMIVWLPDFRFVWSPRNMDVLRSGMESAATVVHPSTGLRLSAHHAVARVVYDRPGDDTVQVAYRPRHTGGIEVAREWGPWRLSSRALFTGTRYPVPAPLNALPAFWTLSGEVARDWGLRGVRGTVALQGDRLLDEKDSLIFAVPEPGRTLRLSLRLRP